MFWKGSLSLLFWKQQKHGDVFYQNALWEYQLSSQLTFYVQKLVRLYYFWKNWKLPGLIASGISTSVT